MVRQTPIRLRAKARRRLPLFRRPAIRIIERGSPLEARTRRKRKAGARLIGRALFH